MFFFVVDRRHDTDERLWPGIHSFSNTCLHSDAPICPGVISNNPIGSRFHRTRSAMQSFDREIIFPVFVVEELLDSRVDSKCPPTEHYHLQVERQSMVVASLPSGRWKTRIAARPGRYFDGNTPTLREIDDSLSASWRPPGRIDIRRLHL